MTYPGTSDLNHPWMGRAVSRNSQPEQRSPMAQFDELGDLPSILRGTARQTMHQEMVWRQANLAAHLSHKCDYSFQEPVEDIVKRVYRLNFHQAEVHLELHYEMKLWKLSCHFFLAIYICICIFILHSCCFLTGYFWLLRTTSFAAQRKLLLVCLRNIQWE